MRKYFVWFALATIAAAPPFARAAHGRAAYIDPTALGQQVQAKMADGQLIISRQNTAMVYESQTRTEERTRVVEVDGKRLEEAFTVEVPVIISKPVTSVTEHRVALARVQAFDMQGKRVDEDPLTEALKEERTILLASRKVPRYYLTIYKPDTLLVVIAPQDLYAAPVGAPLLPAPPIVPPKADAPRVLPAPAAPAREDAPAKPDAEPKADPPPAVPAPTKPIAPRTLPPPAAAAPPGDAPRVLPAPAAPGGAVPLAGMPTWEPQVRMARIVDDKLGLRRYVKDITSETAHREEEVDGIKKLVPVAIEVESITDVERKYPRDLLKIYRADKKPLAEDELAKLKDTERCVLVSADGKEIDPKYLKIVKPEALIVVAPVAPQGHFAPPMIVPAPVPLPAPLPPAP